MGLRLGTYIRSREQTRGELYRHGSDNMATILDFHVCGARRPRTESGETEKRGAEIVFFPGIRYERWEEAAPEEAPPAKRTRRRDTLDLDE